MSLINCPKCFHLISPEAHACPNCGHPIRPVDGPKCYACGVPATARCMNCPALSCALHLKPVSVGYGKGASREMRCKTCRASARQWNELQALIGVIVILIFIT